MNVASPAAWKRSKTLSIAADMSLLPLRSLIMSKEGETPRSSKFSLMSERQKECMVLILAPDNPSMARLNISPLAPPAAHAASNSAPCRRSLSSAAAASL